MNRPAATTTTGSLRPYLAALRPHQWLKNLLVFVPILAGHQLGLEWVGRAVVAFAAFSAVASAAYVVNDLMDLAADRAHPRKRNRPFASGAISPRHGAGMTAGLLLAGFALSVPLGSGFVLVMVAYLASTTAYSAYLKRRLVIDICTLAFLYTARILAGGIATQTHLSVWLLAFAMFFFFCLAAVKRQAELVDLAASGETKAPGRGYDATDLPLITAMATAAGYISVLVMALYVNSHAVAVLYKQPEALWGVCAVLLYWISRIVMVTHRGYMHDDPVVFAAEDRVTHLCALIIVAFALGGTVRWF